MRLQSSDSVIQEFLEPAVQKLPERAITANTTAGKVFFEYASFCKTQLEDQHAILDTKRMENLYKTKQEEVVQLKDALRVARQAKVPDQTEIDRIIRDRGKALKMQNSDKAELQRLHTMRHTFLHKAIENFLKCFSASSEFDQHVPKFCAIWLKHSKDESLQRIVRNLLPSVPSYKFLPLMHQLCSRLSRDVDDFQASLHELVGRICTDHPLHSLHQIFGTGAVIPAGDSVAESRSSAAQQLIERLNRTSKLKDLSPRIRIMFSSYSDLANVPLQRDERRKEYLLSTFPKTRRFRKSLQELHVPPPSLDLPISPDCDYSRVPYVQKYHEAFKVASGLNIPKILDLVLSNGNNVRELVFHVLYAINP